MWGKNSRGEFLATLPKSCARRGEASPSLQPAKLSYATPSAGQINLHPAPQRPASSYTNLKPICRKFFNTTQISNLSCYALNAIPVGGVIL